MFKKIYKTVKSKLAGGTDHSPATVKAFTEVFERETPKTVQPKHIMSRKERELLAVRESQKQENWISKGKWNQTTIRFALKALFVGVDPRGLNVRAMKRKIRRLRYRNMRLVSSRREIAQFHVWAVRQSNKEKGLNQYGFPIHGLKAEVLE